MMINHGVMSAYNYRGVTTMPILTTLTTDHYLAIACFTYAIIIAIALHRAYLRGSR